ncbi:hypothetical protein N7453_009990 [Penicillium expansum]|nr:hypothetical protein N7453_009990 [Penicillium expansum]
MVTRTVKTTTLRPSAITTNGILLPPIVTTDSLNPGSSYGAGHVPVTRTFTIPPWPWSSDVSSFPFTVPTATWNVGPPSLTCTSGCGTASNEVIILAAQQLKSQADLAALVQVNCRLNHLIKHILYRYNLQQRNGDGILRAARLGLTTAVVQFIKEGYPMEDRPIHTEEHPPRPGFLPWDPCSCRLEHPILCAAEYGHSELVKYLLRQRKNGFLSVIKVLLEKGCSIPFLIDNDTKFTLAPIKEAALKGHTHVVEHLLSYAPSPRDYASSTLPFAAISGNIALVSMLLGHGADIDYKYIERYAPRIALYPHDERWHVSTALSVAARLGHLDLVTFLLANDSDVKATTSSLWETALYLAIANGHEEVIEVLLAHGADVEGGHISTAIEQRNKKLLEMLIIKYGTENRQTNFLELAAEAGDTEIFQILFDKGFKDQEKAFLKAIECGQEEIVALLLTQGTDPDLPTIGECAIGKAIVHRDVGIMELLLCHGAHIYPETLRSAKTFAPGHIAKLAEQFPVHPLEKKAIYPSIYQPSKQGGAMTLARIENLIKQTPSQHIEFPDLKAAGIRRLHLSLEDDTQHHPRFFNPYQEKLPLPLKENEDGLLEFEPDPNHIMWDTRSMQLFLTRHFYDCWSYASKKYPHNPPPSVSCREIGDYKFGQLLECIDFNWYAVSVADYPAGNYPHFKVIVESDVNGDDRLLRGEIMTITDIMAARLRTKSLRPHIIAPLLVLSLMSPRHARVLEADLDGEILNIRASRLYDFTQRNTDVAQLLTRYWLGDACGHTTMESS